MTVEWKEKKKSEKTQFQPGLVPGLCSAHTSPREGQLQPHSQGGPVPWGRRACAQCPGGLRLGQALARAGPCAWGDGCAARQSCLGLPTAPPTQAPTGRPKARPSRGPSPSPGGCPSAPGLPLP